MYTFFDKTEEYIMKTHFEFKKIISVLLSVFLVLGLIQLPSATVAAANMAVTKVIVYAVNGDASTLAGGSVQGSNDGPTFGFTNIATIPNDASGAVVTLEVTSNSTVYRYIKYYGRTGSFAKVADIEFYNNAIKLAGTPFGTISKAGNEVVNAFDGNLLTFSRGKLLMVNTMGWI